MYAPCIIFCARRRNPNAWWPSSPLTATAESLTAAALKRAREADGLWHQPGSLGDVIVRHPGQKAARYYREVPVAYSDTLFGRQDEYYVVTLEHPQFAGPEVTRPITRGQASAGIYVRPVVSRYAGGRLLSQHKTLPGPGLGWDDPDSQVAPLRRFFAEQMSS